MAILVEPYRDEYDNKLYVSHGVCTETFQNVPLPSELFKEFIKEHCVPSLEYGGYILKN